MGEEPPNDEEIQEMRRIIKLKYEKHLNSENIILELEDFPTLSKRIVKNTKSFKEAMYKIIEEESIRKRTLFMDQMERSGARLPYHMTRMYKRVWLGN